MTPDQINDLMVLGFKNALAGEHGAALQIYSRILAEHPDFMSAHYYAGQLLLVNGQFEQGWAACEMRPIAPFPPTIPRWQGENLNGQGGDAVLFVAGEQGLGDMLQFVRYVPLLRSLVSKVVVGSLPGLKNLLLTVPGVDAVVEQGEPLPRITHWVPILSLPHVFKTNLTNIPTGIPYMQPNPDKVAQWRERLAWAEGPKVGLVWAGNPDFMGDARRSPGFEPYKELLNVPGITFFSLQKGAGSLALDGVPLPYNLFDLGPEMHDWDDTAAVLMNMDLLISSCTSPAHLAGALGRPLWLVLSHFPDWRWLRQGETSPWYPGARLFRQTPGETWETVLQRVAHSLAEAQK